VHHHQVRQVQRAETRCQSHTHTASLGAASLFSATTQQARHHQPDTTTELINHPGGWQAAGAALAAGRAPWTSTRAAATDAAPADAGAAAPAGAPRVCILGGGFGGLYTAVKLESLIWPKGKKPRVTLIDQGERFVFKPLLYELLNGTAQPWEVAPTFAQLLAPYPVQFVQVRGCCAQAKQLLC
jgi:hypothetical protein